MVRSVAFRGYTWPAVSTYLAYKPLRKVTMKTGELRKPFVPPHILELCPRDSAARQEYLRVTSQWNPGHKISVGLVMSSLLGEGMKREVAREHPEWPAKKISLEVGRLNWGWEIAPPLYGPLEEEARARGESPHRGAKFLASWRLDTADEPSVQAVHRKRTTEEIQHALDQLFSEGPCG